MQYAKYSSVTKNSYDVLPYAIEKLQAAGYNMVTLAECLGESPYQSVGSAGVNDVSSYSFLPHFLKQPLKIYLPSRDPGAVRLLRYLHGTRTCHNSDYYFCGLFPMLSAPFAAAVLLTMLYSLYFRPFLWSYYCPLSLK